MCYLKSDFHYFMSTTEPRVLESCNLQSMGSLIQRVVFSSEKTHTTTYESDGSRLGGWTILNGPAQKTARAHDFLVENEYVFNV